MQRKALNVMQQLSHNILNIKTTKYLNVYCFNRGELVSYIEYHYINT